MAFQTRWISCLFLATSVASSFAQGDSAPTTSLSVSGAKVYAGKSFTATLSITFAEGLHGYQNPPTDPTLIPVTVKLADKVFKLVSVAYPKGVPASVGGETKPVNVYEGTVKIPIKLIAPAKAGKAVLSVSIGYQQCNAASCFPPGTLAAKTSVVVMPAAKATTGKGKH